MQAEQGSGERGAGGVGVKAKEEVASSSRPSSGETLAGQTAYASRGEGRSWQESTYFQNRYSGRQYSGGGTGRYQRSVSSCLSWELFAGILSRLRRAIAGVEQVKEQHTRDRPRRACRITPFAGSLRLGDRFTCRIAGARLRLRLRIILSSSLILCRDERFE
jgi:hypothetical protein